jgi:hypothetical protein
VNVLHPLYCTGKQPEHVPNVQHAAYVCGTCPPASMISRIGNVTAYMEKDVMSALRSTVFSHSREHASATPMKPFRGDSGVHHFKPIVKLRLKPSLFARRSANVVYLGFVVWGAEEAPAESEEVPIQPVGTSEIVPSVARIGRGGRYGTGTSVVWSFLAPMRVPRRNDLFSLPSKVSFRPTPTPNREWRMECVLRVTLLTRSRRTPCAATEHDTEPHVARVERNIVAVTRVPSEGKVLKGNCYNNPDKTRREYCEKCVFFSHERRQLPMYAELYLEQYLLMTTNCETHFRTKANHTLMMKSTGS